MLIWDEMISEKDYVVLFDEMLPWSIQRLSRLVCKRFLLLSIFTSFWLIKHKLVTKSIEKLIGTSAKTWWQILFSQILILCTVFFIKKIFSQFRLCYYKMVFLNSAVKNTCLEVAVEHKATECNSNLCMHEAKAGALPYQHGVAIYELFRRCELHCSITHPRANQ